LGDWFPGCTVTNIIRTLGASNSSNDSAKKGSKEIGDGSPDDRLKDLSKCRWVAKAVGDASAGHANLAGRSPQGHRRSGKISALMLILFQTQPRRIEAAWSLHNGLQGRARALVKAAASQSSAIERRASSSRNSAKP